MLDLDTALRLFNEYWDERTRQLEKWGEQNHPSVDPDDRTALARCLTHGVPTEEVAKMQCNLAQPLTWADIAVEELSEAISADDDAARRKELVQLYAVVGAWIESIDRNKEKENGQTVSV